MVFSFFKKPEVIVAKPAAKPGGAARPLNGSEPVEDVGMASEPAKDLESSQSGLSDFVFSESAPQFHLEPEIDPVDADAQEAAILFANAQDSAARTVLENAVRHHVGASSERLWRMLFDLYHLLGDQVAFEALSVDYARAFEKSPPAWRSAPSAPKPAAPSAGSTLFKGELCGDNLAGFAELERAAAGKRQLRLDLSRVRRFDAAGCGQLLAALQRLRKGGCSIELLGRDALGALLVGSVVPGRAEDQECWLLQLELFQQRGESEAFENLAIDYAVTFEVSPPSWEAARVAAPEVAKAVVAERDNTGPEAYVLEGEYKGVRFADLGAYAETHDPVLIDCVGLKRIDFVSAGALLNVLTGVRSKGRQIVFHQPHHLAAELFGVVGLHAVASIVFAQR